MCNSEACYNLTQYAPERLTWFETACLEHVGDVQKSCMDALAKSLKHSAEHSSTIHGAHSAVPWNILTIFGAFAVGALVRFVFLGTRVPYTVALFILGMVFGFVSKVEAFNLEKYAAISEMNPHLIFHVFLPVLIFESAFAMDIPTFRKVIGQCIIMAVPGLMVASLATAAVAKVCFKEYEWDWFACLLFGTILSATDPVAVVALLKELGASPVISTMIEGESLFNDGTAIVFFTVLIGAIKKESCTPVWTSCTGGCLCSEWECVLDKGIGSIVIEFCKVSFGGALVGLVVGVIAVWSLNKVFNDALIEITLTLVAAYVTFFTAEGFLHVSGVIGVVACGCYMSYFSTCISPEVEHTLHHFWEMTVYLTNTMIFILAGIICALKAFDTVQVVDVGYLAITYVTINVVRAAVLLLFSPVLYLFEYKLTKGTAALVAWGGLRGAVGLSLALMVQGDEDVVFESMRTKLIFHVAGICILTLCINGITTQNLVKYFQLDALPHRKRKKMSQVWQQLITEREQEVTDLRAEPLYYDTNWEQLGRFTDFCTTLPGGMEDPYNEKGWSATESAYDDPSTLLRKAEENGTMAYLNTCEASVHAQLAFGTLSREGVRRLHHMIVHSTEQAQSGAPGGGLHLLPSDPIDCSPNWKMNITRAVPRMHDKAVRGRLVHGYDAALGYIQCHRLANQRIMSLCDPAVAARIQTHCKRVIGETVHSLSQLAKERPEISCSIKTRQAARHVLNAMRREIGHMKHEGHLDAQDAAVLAGIVTQSMKRLRRMTRSMDHPTAVEAVEDVDWFRCSEQQCQAELRRIAAGGLVELEAKTPLADRVPSPRAGGRPGAREAQLPGLYLIVSGVVQLRVGRRMYFYGSGYTLGWQQVLTGSARFSDALTETECRLVRLTEDEIRPLLRQHPNFNQAAWRCCGVAASRILMGLHESQGRFDPKAWDDRRIRKAADRGQVEHLQDPEAYAFDFQRKYKLREGAVYMLLRGKAWEYGEENDHLGTSNLCRFPTLMPAGWKFGTFTGHSVLYAIDEEDTAVTRSRRRWGRLRSKVRSIFIWSNLRGSQWGRVALARAFNRPDPEYDPKSPWHKSPAKAAPREAAAPSPAAPGLLGAPGLPPAQPCAGSQSPARQPQQPPRQQLQHPLQPPPQMQRQQPPLQMQPQPPPAVQQRQGPSAAAQPRAQPPGADGRRRSTTSDASSEVTPPPTPPPAPVLSRGSGQSPVVALPVQAPRVTSPRVPPAFQPRQEPPPGQYLASPVLGPVAPQSPQARAIPVSPGSVQASAAHRARNAPSPTARGSGSGHRPPGFPGYEDAAYPSRPGIRLSASGGTPLETAGPAALSPLSGLSAGSSSPRQLSGSPGPPQRQSSSALSRIVLPAGPDFNRIMDDVRKEEGRQPSGLVPHSGLAPSSGLSASGSGLAPGGMPPRRGSGRGGGSFAL